MTAAQPTRSLDPHGLRPLTLTDAGRRRRPAPRAVPVAAEGRVHRAAGAASDRGGADLEAAFRRLVEAERTGRKRRATDPLERRLRGGLGRYWRAQRDTLLDQLDALRRHFAEAPSDAARDFDRLWQTVEDIDGGALADLVDDLTGQAAQAGAVAAGLDVGLDLTLDVDNPQAIQALRDRGARLVSRIDETTRTRLRRLIVDGVEQRRTYAAIADDISTTFTGFSNRSTLGHLRTRAELVAVQEIGEAYGQAGDMLADDLTAAGLQVERRLLVTPDDRLCPTCIGDELDGWIAYRATFSSGATRAPIHVGCRCDIETRTADRQPSVGMLPGQSPFVPA